MSHRFVTVVFLAILLALPAAVMAGNTSPIAATMATSAVLAPDAIVAGLTLGEWHARYWQWEISLLNPDTDPWIDDTGARCAYGQNGPVFFLAYSPAGATVQRSCAVPAGVTIFIPMQNVECSSIEPPPYFGANEAELSKCAAEHIDIGLDQDLPMNALTVDGQSVDVSLYRAPSPLFTVNWAVDNEVEVPAGVSLSVGDGYAVMVGPLDEGDHVIEMAVPDGAGAVAHLTYQLAVTSGAPSPAATPEV